MPLETVVACCSVRTSSGDFRLSVVSVLASDSSRLTASRHSCNGSKKKGVAILQVSGPLGATASRCLKCSAEWPACHQRKPAMRTTGGGGTRALAQRYQRPACMRMATSQSSKISSLVIFTRTPSTPCRPSRRSHSLPIRLSSRFTCSAVHSSMMIWRTLR